MLRPDPGWAEYSMTLVAIQPLLVAPVVQTQRSHDLLMVATPVWHRVNSKESRPDSGHLHAYETVNHTLSDASDTLKSVRANSKETRL